MYFYRAVSRVDNVIGICHSLKTDIYISSTFYLYRAGSRVDNRIEIYHSMDTVIYILVLHFTFTEL